MSVFMTSACPSVADGDPTFAIARSLQAHTHLDPGLKVFKEDIVWQGLTFITLFSSHATRDPNVGDLPHLSATALAAGDCP